jgi:hypothetical protein
VKSIDGGKNGAIERRPISGREGFAGLVANQAGRAFESQRKHDPGFEKGRRVPSANNLAAIRHAFEEAGVEFTDDGHPGMKLTNG